MDDTTKLTHTPGQPPPPHPAPQWVSIDFANTVEWRLGDNPTDRLTGYDKMLAWGERAGLLETEVAESLRSVTGQLSGDDAVFKLADPGSPTIILDSSSGDALYVLMPMRV